jgi:4-hydroxyproline epimerase
MSEKRQHFLQEFDWIRKGLMFEPRGHDMMSGSILYPPHHPENDSGILFIETSGCLPMCGHGTIGTVTIAIQEGFILPKKPGFLRLETPAGLVPIKYKLQNNKVVSVQLTNVPSYLAATDIPIFCEGLGNLLVDVAFGGNFYTIIDVQPNFKGLEYYSADQLIHFAQIIKKVINDTQYFVHPENETINECSHVLFSGKVLNPQSTARNAVVYGKKAIDRSPCGTGTSARMAQWYAKGLLKKGDVFIHESIIGSVFNGTIEEELTIAGMPAIRPAIEGWAKVFGYNTIQIDTEDDPYALGFQVL